MASLLSPPAAQPLPRFPPPPASSPGPPCEAFLLVGLPPGFGFLPKALLFLGAPSGFGLRSPPFFRRQPRLAQSLDDLGTEALDRLPERRQIDGGVTERAPIDILALATIDSTGSFATPLRP